MLFLRRLVCVVTLATVFFTSLSAQVPQPSPTPPQPQKSQSKCEDTGTYMNSKGETTKRPRIVRPRLKAPLHNAATEVTASARAGAGPVRITAVSPSGCD
jgi:hypothetical protein